MPSLVLLAWLGLASCGTGPGGGAPVPPSSANDGGPTTTDAGSDATVDCAGVDTTSNPAHCGGCGHDCGGGACTAGQCQPVLLAAAGLRFPESLAVDSASVYWVDQGSASTFDGVIGKVPIAGGPIQVLAPAEYFPTGIAVDGNEVLWLSGVQNGPSVYPEGLRHCSTNGGDASTSSAAAFARRVTAFKGSTYLGDACTGTTCGTNAEVVSATVAMVPAGGGAMTTLLPPPPSTSGASTRALRVDADGVVVLYVTTAGKLEVKALPLGSGAAKTLASGLDDPTSDILALTPSAVYWASYEAGTVRRLPRAGGAAEVFASGLPLPTSMAVDGAFLYITNQGDKTGGSTGSIERIALADGSRKTLATGLTGPGGIVADERNIYWREIGRPNPDPLAAKGAIFKLAK